MLSTVINPFMGELLFTNNMEHTLLLLWNLLILLLLSCFYDLVLIYSGGYQPPSQQTQDSVPSVGYRPPLSPGSSELAEVAPEPVEEEPEKNSVRMVCDGSMLEKCCSEEIVAKYGEFSPSGPRARSPFLHCQ